MLQLNLLGNYLFWMYKVLAYLVKILLFTYNLTTIDSDPLPKRCATYNYISIHVHVELTIL